MKAAVVVSHGKVEIWDISPPEMGPYDAFVQIEACGLCGTTDRHIVEGHQPHHPANCYPAILGHEAVGRVVKVGEKVRKFKVGDRVTRPLALWPETQRDGLYSAWGGFSEYGIVRDSTVPGAPEPDYNSTRQNVVSPKLSLEDAVTAISIAEVASWMEKLSNFKGKDVVICGGGFSSAVMCQCARGALARNIIVVGRTASKFEWSLNNGATHAVLFDENARSAIQQITGEKGADWVLDAAGHQSIFEAGLSYLKPGGTAAIYGAPDGFSYRLPLGAVGGDFELKLYGTADDVFFDEACSRMLSGRLDATRIRTHGWKGLGSLPSALKEQAAGKVLKGLVLISPSS